jgi:hypothetical protein
MWPDSATLELISAPALRSLRVVDGINHVASLAKLGTPPWHTLSLRFGVGPRDVEPFCQVKNLTALRHLTFEAQDIDQDLLDPVWQCPLTQQLETLVVRCQTLRDVVPLWSAALRHLQCLTILPGGTASEPGWELMLRREQMQSHLRFRYHWPYSQADAYSKLAALLVALPPLSAATIEVVPHREPPTPPQRKAIEVAARRIGSEVGWVASD